MDATAAELLPHGVNIAALGLEIRGAVKRTGSRGPFFTELDGSLNRISSQLTLGGRGLRTVAARLKEDAARERTARAAKGSKG